MTERDKALLEAFKQRAVAAESALNKVRIYAELAPGVQYDQPRLAGRLHTIASLCRENAQQALVTTEIFCRQFPD